MSSPIPIILCGKTTQVGQGVIDALKPEYEVIHFVQFASRGVVEIPPILKGEVPPPRTNEADDESNIGSKNYAQTPKAILLGGGQTDDDIAQMRRAAKDIIAIPWIRPDLTKPMPPFGTKEYGMRMVQRAEATFKELEEKGEMGKDGVYWY